MTDQEQQGKSFAEPLANAPNSLSAEGIHSGGLDTTGELNTGNITEPSVCSMQKSMPELDAQAQQNLYQYLGQLSQNLRQSAAEFGINPDSDAENQSLTSDPTQQVISEIADAKDRLNYIMNLTQSAANRTMDKVDESLPLTQQLSEEAASLHYEWGRLKRREITPQEFRNLYERLDNFLISAQEQTRLVNGNFSDIILAQDYQDLTGQVAKKVITLVHELEASLIGLMHLASKIEQITGIEIEDTETLTQEVDKNIVPEGPVMNAQERGIDVVAGQDDVDDLLSSLGL